MHHIHTPFHQAHTNEARIAHATSIFGTVDVTVMVYIFTLYECAFMVILCQFDVTF